MKKIYYCWILCALSACAAFAQEAYTGEWGVITNELQMSIALDGADAQVKSGQPYALLIRYKNNSTNETFALYEVGGIVDDSNYSFIVISPSGKDVSPDMTKVQRPFSGVFRHLSPGKILGIKYRLDKFFCLDEIGTYKITLRRKEIFLVSKNKKFEAASNSLEVKVVSAKN